MSLVLQSSGGGSVTIAEPTTASDFTQTLPAVTGNVVIDSATQTLTNKTIEGGTVISGTAVASTSGTSIDFTGIPSWVKRITVMFDGISTNGTSPILIQLGSTTFSTTGYISFGINGNTGSYAGASQTAGLAVTNVIIAASTYSGSAVISNISGNVWSYTAQLGSASNVFTSGAGSSPSLSGVLDRIRITTVSGTNTFDAGTINILYE